VSGLDRIRRVLSDAGGALRRASDLPPAPARPANADGGAETDARARLRARLEALRAEAVGRRSDSQAGASPAVEDPDAVVYRAPEDDGKTLEERIGGTVRTGPRGSFLLVERRWPLSTRHGNVRLGDALERPLPLRRRERLGEHATVDPRRAVFLDVETTGLAGGTGTVAFLIGAGRIEGDEFVVRQYFLRDFPDEPPALEALAEDLGDAPLVTFNGRTFDWPLLTTRLRIHRTPVADRPHLDMLPPARRIWAGSLASHALSDLEHHVLGVVRGEDLPGAFIPPAYFDWLRTGRSAMLALAFRHNEIDIVSLLALTAEASRILADPASRPEAPARDHLSTAFLLLDHGDPDRARACLDAAARAGMRAGERSVRRVLGTLLRRTGDLPGAMRTWERWIAEEPDFDPHPYEELAKAYEHRRREPAAALALVEAAIARCPRGERRESLEHRAERLRRKSAS
jgi:uncharacterized protein YprB with RNaseH-like and TPR domain